MAFTKVNPSGWSLGAKLTSAQINQLDADHASALDKSSAGDVLSGIVVLGIGGQIQSPIIGGIRATVAGGITSDVNGGFRHDTGPSDWVGFLALRTRTTMGYVRPLAAAISSGWSNVATLGLQGPATTSVQLIEMPPMHNGATLQSITVSYKVPAIHSGIPVSLPSLLVYRQTVGVGTPSQVTLSFGAISPPVPSSGAAWHNSGLEKSDWIYVPTQNAIIDTTQYLYYAQLVDENGANSVAGNLFNMLQLTFSNIADMRFP